MVVSILQCKPFLFIFTFKNKSYSQLQRVTKLLEHIMFVCICNAITDHDIKETIAAGATTMSDLQAQLGVATCCGCCGELAASFLTASSAQNTVTAGINVQS